jgi:glycosyltransferase involved in cell wall biosynthesis
VHNVESPLISVIVPFFDSERHIAACIESLLSQDAAGAPYEILLIDNGSTDNSRAIVERYPELIVLEESKPGAYAARNTGIRQTRAPLIAFTDADCVVAPDWLRSIQTAMQDRAVAVLLGHCSYPRSASLGLRLLRIRLGPGTDRVLGNPRALAPPR